MEKLHYKYNNKERPVILFIHGFLGSSQQWDALIYELDPAFSILSIDLPGHGHSPEFTESYSLKELSLCIDSILIKENIETLHVVGHSMGGYLGAALATTIPDKILSLTLINSIASEDPSLRRDMRNRSIKLIEKHQSVYISMAISNLFTDEERTIFKREISEMKQQAEGISIKSIIQALECMRDRPNFLPWLKNMPFTVLYIYGTKDHIIPVQLVEKELAYLKCSGKKIHCGHLSLLTNSAELLNNMHFIE